MFQRWPLCQHKSIIARILLIQSIHLKIPELTQPWSVWMPHTSTTNIRGKCWYRREQQYLGLVHGLHSSEGVATTQFACDFILTQRYYCNYERWIFVDGEGGLGGEGDVHTVSVCVILPGTSIWGSMINLYNDCYEGRIWMVALQVRLSIGATGSDKSGCTYVTRCHSLEI